MQEMDTVKRVSREANHCSAVWNVAQAPNALNALLCPHHDSYMLLCWL